MEILKVVSFYRSRIKFVTLHELLASNTQLLIRDLNKIGKHSRVIKNECQVSVEFYRILYSVYCCVRWVVL